MSLLADVLVGLNSVSSSLSKSSEPLLRFFCCCWRTEVRVTGAAIGLKRCERGTAAKEPGGTEGPGEWVPLPRRPRPDPTLSEDRSPVLRFESAPG